MASLTLQTAQCTACMAALTWFSLNLPMSRACGAVVTASSATFSIHQRNARWWHRFLAADPNTFIRLFVPILCLRHPYIVHQILVLPPSQGYLRRLYGRYT